MKTETKKIQISTASDEALGRILDKVKEGFSGGKIGKTDLLSWIINYFEAHALEASLEEIRKNHFDQINYLESVIKELKQARKNGASSNLEALLLPVTSKKKRKQELPLEIESKND